MLFLETSHPHFSKALVSLVDGAVPPHAFSWFSRAPSDPKAMQHLEQAKERRSFARSCILRTCMAKPPLDLHSLPYPSHLHLRGSSSTHTGFLSAGLSTWRFPLLLSHSSRCLILSTTLAFHCSLSATSWQMVSNTRWFFVYFPGF